MALKEMTIPDPPKLYTKKYANLGGVDFSCEASQVDPNRTPTGTNMISDRGGNPAKRLGWRQIAKDSTITGKILKIIPYDRDDNTTPYPDLWVIATDGVCFYRHTDATSASTYTETRLMGTEIKPISIDNCVAFNFNGELYCGISKVNTNMGNQTFGIYKMSATDGTPTMTNLCWEAHYSRGEAYIPETTFGLAPNGSGGTSLEAVNLLTPTMTFSFCGDSTSKTYYLYPETLRTDKDKQKILYETLKVEVLNSDGKWVTMVEGRDYTVSGKQSPSVVGYYDYTGGLNSSGYICDAKVNFTSTHETQDAGRDNVKITFTPFDITAVYYSLDPPLFRFKGLKNLNAIDFMSATCCELYGHTTADRVFMGGFKRCTPDEQNKGREFKNRVYYSQVNDPAYFPDNNYLTVGHDDNYVMTLQKVGDYLAAVKSDSTLDCSLYLIRGSYLDDSMYFMVIPTSVMLGAISSKASATLIDEPLYLSHDGIFAITATNYRSEERSVRCRSGLVNKRLLKESGLENACATVWDRYYILCINNHCYILDGRKYSADAKKNSDYQVEAYYWEGIPASTFATYENELYFGTWDGRICKFNTDIPDETRYCDDGTEVDYELDPLIVEPLERRRFDPRSCKILSPEHWKRTKTVPDCLRLTDGTAIKCEWSTPLDDDGAPQYFKTLNKKGNLVMLEPAIHTSAKVSLIKDGTKMFSLNTFYYDIFDWANVWFANFSFRSDLTPRDDFVKKKVKKYKRLQIVVENDGLYEPFSIISITKTYFYGNFAK